MYLVPILVLIQTQRRVCRELLLYSSTLKGGSLYKTIAGFSWGFSLLQKVLFPAYCITDPSVYNICILLKDNTFF